MGSVQCEVVFSVLRFIHHSQRNCILHLVRDLVRIVSSYVTILKQFWNSPIHKWGMLTSIPQCIISEFPVTLNQ